MSKHKDSNEEIKIAEGGGIFSKEAMNSNGGTDNDHYIKRSASFGDFTANLLKIESNKTDFSIVAPKIDQNELYCSQSEIDWTEGGHRSLYLKRGG